MIAEKWSNNTIIYYVYNANGIAGFVYNGIPYVYQKNVFGDIVAIYDNAGTKVAGYRYNAFGENFIYYQVGTIGEINPFRYRGYYYDTESGLYYLQSRYYDPAMGRFINADDVAFISQDEINGLNLYSYSLNNPLIYCDPSGHFVLALAIGAGIGALFGGIVSGVSAYRSGKQGKDFWGAVAKGAIEGAILGAVTTIGGLTAIGTYANATTKALTMIGGTIASGALSFGGGLLSYMTESAIIGRENNTQDMFKNAFIMAGKGAGSFGLGAYSSSHGFWTSLGKKEFGSTFNVMRELGKTKIESAYMATTAYVKNNYKQIIARGYLKYLFVSPWGEN